MTGPNTDRDARIAAAARLGQTHDAIAREHGITRARVSQIVAASKTPVSAEETQRQLIAALCVPIIHPCWSGRVLVLVEGAAEPVPVFGHPGA